jgi:hypothetical protein
MASAGRIFTRIFFWCYERGSWQYDVAVVIILLFVFATPRRWLHDQPQLDLSSTPGQVQLISVLEEDHRETYRLDTRVLAPPAQTPALQNELHNALQRALPALHGGRFSITKIEPVRDEQGTVIAYQVEIRR